MPADQTRRPLIVAHRGASAIAPENTCLALTAAIDLGADMVEVDVQLSRDGHPVIFHDWHCGRLGRSARHSRRALRALRIAEATLEDLRQVDVGSWKGPTFIDLKMPTLEELLAHCGGTISVNLELKIPGGPGSARRAELIGRVVEALERYPGREGILLSSFDRGVLELARSADPDARLGILPQPDGVLQTLRLADQVHAYSVHLRCAEVRPSVVRDVHASGRQLYAYTADRPGTMRRLIAAGVDGIFTNVPDRLKAIREQVGKSESCKVVRSQGFEDFRTFQP